MKTLTASTNPHQDIELLSYPTLPRNMRLYHSGYEHLFNRIPVVTEKNKDKTLPLIQSVMRDFASQLQNDPVAMTNTLEAHEFQRMILALEPPLEIHGLIEERTEVIVAQWGDKFTSPVHGHPEGYMHEEVLSGKIRVNTYRVTNARERIARPFAVEVHEKGTFISRFAAKSNELIHNFISLGSSVTLHHLPGQRGTDHDNLFYVEHFSDCQAMSSGNMIRIDSLQAMYLQRGDVVLVRSLNVPDLGDHFIVVTGPVTKKPHGMRVHTHSIPASHENSRLLDEYTPQTGLVLLKLPLHMRNAFLAFHGIAIIDGEVKLPNI